MRGLLSGAAETGVREGIEIDRVFGRGGNEFGEPPDLRYDADGKKPRRHASRRSPMRRLRWLEQSVQRVTHGAGKVGARLVRDWVIGSVVAGSTILSAIARALEASKRGFEAGLERLSRGLKKQGKAIRRAVAVYRRRAVRAMRQGGFDVVAIDLSEIVKPYGRKMPFLCAVRDGSQSRRNKTVLEKGWWTVEVTASRRSDHTTLPLWRHVYSTVDPEFKSEPNEVRRALSAIAADLPREVRAVLDRGFDGDSSFGVLDDHFSHWAVRLRGDRDLRLPGREKLERASIVGRALRKENEARPVVVRKGKLERVSVRFGYCTVELPGGRAFRRRGSRRRVGLIAAERLVQHDPSEPPMMLLVSQPVRSAAEARRWVEDYYRRWSVEEETRGAKQLGGLEDVRVLEWERIKNVVALSVMTEGVLALLQIEAPRRATRLARLAPIDGEVPAFALYRIWMSVALLLQDRALVK